MVVEQQQKRSHLLCEQHTSITHYIHVSRKLIRHKNPYKTQAERGFSFMCVFSNSSLTIEMMTITCNVNRPPFQNNEKQQQQQQQQQQQKGKKLACTF